MSVLPIEARIALAGMIVLMLALPLGVIVPAVAGAATVAAFAGAFTMMVFGIIGFAREGI